MSASSTSAEVRAIFVDDDPSDLKLAARLTRAGLICDPLTPPDSLDELIEDLTRKLKSDWNLVLLDYRLDTQSDSSRANYRGGSVAAAIKEVFPMTPVVLITTEQKFKRSVAHNPNVRALFDHQILKDDLHAPSRRRTIAAELNDLGLGYLAAASMTNGTKPSWASIGDLLEADDQEVLLLPDFWQGSSPAPSLVELCPWLLHELLLYPGAVLDQHQAAARLGLTLNSFNQPQVQSGLGTAGYAGPFSSLRRRWWRGRLVKLLRRWAADDADSSAELRVNKIARRLKVVKLTAAKCIWCGSGAVQRACDVCNEPVDVSHALVGYIDERPRWAEPAMVCFDCVEKGRAKDIRFEAGSGDLVRQLQKGQVNREPVGS